jgi:hypothetical protein
MGAGLNLSWLAADDAAALATGSIIRNWYTVNAHG